MVSFWGGFTKTKFWKDVLQVFGVLGMVLGFWRLRSLEFGVLEIYFGVDLGLWVLEWRSCGVLGALGYCFGDLGLPVLQQP